MPDVTVKRPYPKSGNTKAQVQEIQKHIMDNKDKTGAKSCDLTEDSNNYYLTTVYESDD